MAILWICTSFLISFLFMVLYEIHALYLEIYKRLCGYPLGDSLADEEVLNPDSGI